MRRLARTSSRHALGLAAILLLASPVASGQDYLGFSATSAVDHHVEIDFTAETHGETVQVQLTLENTDPDGNGRQLVVFSNAPFPITLERIDGHESTWYELTATPGSEVSAHGLVLARNIFPNLSGACDGEEQPPCEYTIDLEFELGVLGQGVLARAGQYDLRFLLTFNENPITIDFTDFFNSLEPGTP